MDDCKINLLMFFCSIIVTRYPAQSHLVLAFTGAPASFPVTEQCAANHQYLQWSADISGKAEKFIAEEIGEKQRFLGIHMRNGVDWVSVYSAFLPGDFNI